MGCNCGRDLGVVCGVAGARRVIAHDHDMGVTSGQQYRVAISSRSQVKSTNKAMF